MSTSSGKNASTLHHAALALLEECYEDAGKIVAEGNVACLEAIVGSELHSEISQLGEANHAGRGVALTLMAAKACLPLQDVRAHKVELEGGFAARTLDTAVTVPFLLRQNLPRSVETHWLTQTFSYAGKLIPGLELKTTPKKVGPLLVKIVNAVQFNGSVEVARAGVTAILVELIRIRNRERVELTVPKSLEISAVMKLLSRHFQGRYAKNAPRLPQCALYAMYRCLASDVSKYRSMELRPLGRMKSADRKAGTVGDIELYLNGIPHEAVEIKLGVPLRLIHVQEACQKVKSHSVRRYYILSTSGIDSNDAGAIEETKAAFFRSNGCELIVNGVIETMSYYLRLLSSTDLFLVAYTNVLNEDPDVTYEHKVAWNEICEKR